MLLKNRKDEDLKYTSRLFAWVDTGVLLAGLFFKTSIGGKIGRGLPWPYLFYDPSAAKGSMFLDIPAFLKDYLAIFVVTLPIFTIFIVAGLIKERKDTK